MSSKQTPLSIYTVCRMVLSLAGAMFVAACSGDMASHIWGDSDVPDAVLQQPRQVAAPSEDEAKIQTWLRLGDVPSKPTDFSSPSDVMKKKQDMLGLRTEGQAIRAAHPELYDESGTSPTPPQEGHP